MDSERRLSPDEARAEDEAQGQPEDGSVMLTNDSGETKRVSDEEWSNEERQAELLQQGWKEVGADQS